MSKGTFLGRPRWLVLLLPVVVLALAFGPSVASAATNDATGATSASVGSSSATINFTGTAPDNPAFSTSDLVTGNTLPPCTPGVAEPPGPNNSDFMREQAGAGNLCDHFLLKVNAPGVVDIPLNFDNGTFVGDRTVNLYLINPCGFVVAQDENLGTSDHVGPYTVPSGPTDATGCNPLGTYDVATTLSSAVVFALSTGTDGRITFTPTQQTFSSCFKKRGEHQEGSGETQDHGKFRGEGHRDDQRGEKDGHAKYDNMSTGQHFRSTQTDNVEFVQLGTNPLSGNPIWQMTMTGQGTNNGNPVTYTIVMVDNGLNGLGDTFTLTTSDGKVAGGQLTSGSNSYHHYAD